MKYIKKFNESDNLFFDPEANEIIDVLENDRFTNASKSIIEKPIYRYDGKSTETSFKFTTDRGRNIKVTLIESDLTDERILIRINGSFTDISFDDGNREKILKLCQDKIK